MLQNHENFWYNLAMKNPKVLTYTVVFEKAKEGGYIAHVPLLPGCTTQGETFAETKSNIKDAIAAYLDVLKADGDQIPVEDAKHITRKIAVVPVHAKELKRGLLFGILKQLNLTVEDLRKKIKSQP